MNFFLLETLSKWFKPYNPDYKADVEIENEILKFKKVNTSLNYTLEKLSQDITTITQDSKNT